MNLKGIPLPTMEILENKPERAELVSEWERHVGVSNACAAAFRAVLA